MLTTNDTYQYSSSNYQTFSYPSSFDSKQYTTNENHSHHFNYPSSTYSFDSYSTDFTIPIDYNSTTYQIQTDPYCNSNSIYLDSNTNLTPPPSSSTLQWNSPMNKISNRTSMDRNSSYSSSRNEYKTNE